MKMVKHTYGDPTGGGEDITLTAPEWVANVPPEIRVTTQDFEALVFDLEDTEEDDEMYEEERREQG